MATNWLDKQQVRSEVSSVVGAANASIVELRTTQVSDQVAFASYQLRFGMFGPAFSSVSNSI